MDADTTSATRGTSASPHRNPGAAIRWQEGYDRILGAWHATGVTPTSRDREVAEWIAGWEAETVEAIASWIVRAAADKG